MAELCLHIPVSVKDALREQSGPRSFMEREHRLKKDNLSVGFVQLASFPQEIGTFEEKKCGGGGGGAGEERKAEGNGP